MIDHLQFNKQKYYPVTNDNFIQIPKKVKITKGVTGYLPTLTNSATYEFTSDATGTVVGVTAPDYGTPSNSYLVQSDNGNFPVKNTGVTMIDSADILWIKKTDLTPIN